MKPYLLFDLATFHRYVLPDLWLTNSLIHVVEFTNKENKSNRAHDFSPSMPRKSAKLLVLPAEILDGRRRMISITAHHSRQKQEELDADASTRSMVDKHKITTEVNDFPVYSPSAHSSRTSSVDCSSASSSSNTTGKHIHKIPHTRWIYYSMSG